MRVCALALIKQVGKWFTVPERAPRAAFANLPHELVDLVRLATAARRGGYPDIIWTSWCPGAHATPGHGTTLVMCTVSGAAQILARLPPSPHEMPPTTRMSMGHFDLELKAHLQQDDEHGLVGCYVHPPVGLYAVHPS